MDFIKKFYECDMGFIQPEEIVTYESLVQEVEDTNFRWES